ncbi:FadR/GntR family transcriptional regulator [Sphingomonas sp. GM_Shp_1]|uniref:FadR/GntR family transcriptional regulator n=1 Tax=Sphingomonas sp. GM_Shp_1 TaxID=2937381 RepID=UPI00226BA559|nr:FadR/GntR family transcriptional regulator [Sphingomonas sp. GM_Shp_1]
MDNTPTTQDRLYRELARTLIAELVEGRYPVGTRMPAERELAARFDVSRPVIREALIALEVQGFIEVRIGSGAHVVALPGQGETPDFGVSAMEVAEARLLFEPESAALAASQITDAELDELAALVDAIEEENNEVGGAFRADRAFHTLIARVTRNSAILETIDRLWEQRERSAESALLDAKVRAIDVRPIVEHHAAILEALRARDSLAARAAMQRHLTAALEGLLIASEARAVAEVRQALAAKRDRTAHLKI